MILEQQLKISNRILFIPSKSLKHIKTEILLTFVAELFEDYLRIKNNPEFSCSLNFIDNKLIDQSIIDFLKYFSENIIRKKQLIELFQDANGNSLQMVHVKQYETFGVYYRKLSGLLLHYLSNDSKFMPEYFGILLMYYFKTETSRIFSDFIFIQEFDFSSLLSIYEDTNITLKKELSKINPNAKFWEHRTTIDNMEKIAFHLIKKYDSFQYKINTSRKSKKRLNK